MSILKNTVIVSIMTFFSRLLGMVRDILIAAVFGICSEADAFFLAFRGPDLMRKLFSEGTLSISFIPVFARCLKTQGKEEAASMVFSALFIMSVLSVVLMVSGVAFAPYLLKFISPEFYQDGYTYSLTILLMKIMAPYLMIVLFLAVFMGVLHTFNKFSLPACAPVIFNLVIIFFICNASIFFKLPVIALAVGVVVGGIAQLIFQVPAIISLTFFSLKKIRWLHPGVIQTFRNMFPAMIGASVYPINMLIASFLAITLGQGNVSFLYFSDRLVQFPLALFAGALATVLLPELSRQAVIENKDKISEAFNKGLRLILFISIPSFTGLIALRSEIVSLLFEYGAFDQSASVETSECLLYLALGLWALSGTKLFVTLFNSLEDTITPFKTGFLSIGINLLLSLHFLEHYGLQGLAISISISTMVNFFLLFINAPDFLDLNLTQTALNTGKTLLVSFIMYVCVRFFASLIFYPDYGKLMLLTGTVSSILLGVGVFFGISMFTSKDEINTIKQVLRRG